MTIAQAKMIQETLREYENSSYWLEKLDELQLRCSTNRYVVKIEGFDYTLAFRHDHTANIVEAIRTLYEKKLDDARRVIEEIE